MITRILLAFGAEHRRHGAARGGRIGNPQHDRVDDHGRDVDQPPQRGRQRRVFPGPPNVRPGHATRGAIATVAIACQRRTRRIGLVESGATITALVDPARIVAARLRALELRSKPSILLANAAPRNEMLRRNVHGRSTDKRAFSPRAEAAAVGKDDPNGARRRARRVSERFYPPESAPTIMIVGAGRKHGVRGRARSRAADEHLHVRAHAARLVDHAEANARIGGIERRERRRASVAGCTGDLHRHLRRARRCTSAAASGSRRGTTSPPSVCGG